jgi:hypothetical protein
MSFNEEARRVIYVMVETGLRPSEIVNLTPKTIHLNHQVPHVEVEPEGRVLKTETSRRHIPLVGVSLAAMRLQPKGFPRYFDKGSTLSANVNKYLENHDLVRLPAVAEAEVIHRAPRRHPAWVRREAFHDHPEILLAERSQIRRRDFGGHVALAKPNTRSPHSSIEVLAGFFRFEFGRSGRKRFSPGTGVPYPP